MAAVALFCALSSSVLIGETAQAAGSYRVLASPYLNVRSGPYTTSQAIASKPYGAAVWIYCQVRSTSSVNGSTMWDFLGFDRLGRQNWVSDYWMSTPAFNQFSPGMFDCNGRLNPQGMYYS